MKPVGGAAAGVQVSAQWIGSGATIALVPHTCLIYPDTNTLKCSPAKLVLYRTEGAPPPQPPVSCSSQSLYVAPKMYTCAPLSRSYRQQRIDTCSLMVLTPAPCSATLGQCIDF